MNNNDLDIRELLLMYEVAEPAPELVFRTKRMMRDELRQLSEAPSWQAGWIVMLVGLAFTMTLGLFYTFTVGTILSFALPSNLAEIMYYTLFAFAATGGVLIAGLLMVFYFKQCQAPAMR